MDIDFDKISSIYGRDTLDDLKDNIDIVLNNLKYLSIYNLDSINDIFERYVLLFMFDEDVFRNRVDYLFNTYGYMIDENLELWEEIQ